SQKNDCGIASGREKEERAFPLMRSLRMSLPHATTCPYYAGVPAKPDFSIRISVLLLLGALFLLPATAAAQTGNEPFNSGVYRVGERLTYNVNYSKFVSAAHVELFVAARGAFFGREGIQLRGHVETS